MDLLRHILRIISSAVGDSLDPKDPRTKAQGTDYQNGNAEQQPIAAAIDTLTESLKSTEQYRDEHERKILAIETKRLRIEYVVMGTVVIGTIGALITLYFVKRSTDAVTNQARASQAQVDAMYRSSRAVVGPPVIYRGVVVKPGSIVQIIPVFKNSGSTPALDYQQTAHFVMRDKDWRFVPEYPFTIDTSAFGVLAQSSESVFPLQSDAQLSEADIAAMRKGRRILYVYGFVTYRDIFNTCYKTTFCMRLNQDLISLAACSNTDYNRMDEQPCSAGHKP